MRFPTLLTLAATAALLFPASASAQLPGGSISDVAGNRRAFLSEVLRNVEATVTAWKAAREADDVAAAAALYSDDATFFPYRGQHYAGRGKLREGLAAQFASEDDFRATMTDFTAGGTLAYYSGDYTYQLRRPGGGEPITAAGTYILVLERQGRSWRIRSHVERADLDLLEQQTATIPAAPAAPDTVPVTAAGS